MTAKEARDLTLSRKVRCDGQYDRLRLSRIRLSLKYVYEQITKAAKLGIFEIPLLLGDFPETPDERDAVIARLKDAGYRIWEGDYDRSVQMIGW